MYDPQTQTVLRLAHFESMRSWQGTVYGRRALWQELNQVYTLWQQLQQPGVEQYRVAVQEDGRALLLLEEHRFTLP